MLSTVMYRGLTFDGLDNDNVQPFFLATDQSNQYRARSSTIDIKSTTSMTPTFNLKSKSNSTNNSTLNVGTVQAIDINASETVQAKNINVTETIESFAVESNTIQSRTITAIETIEADTVEAVNLIGTGSIETIGYLQAGSIDTDGALSAGSINAGPITSTALITTSSGNIASYYEATAQSNQFRTNSEVVDIKSNTSLAPNFNLKNSAGTVVASTLNVGSVETLSVNCATANVGNAVNTASLNSLSIINTNNITTGTLNTGTLTATANVSAANFVASGNISAFQISATSGISTNGTVTAVTGFSTPAGTVTANTISSGVIYNSTNINTTGNLTAGSINTAPGGAITSGGSITSPQNITAGGTISTLGTVSGGTLVSSGAVTASGVISTAGSITAGTSMAAGTTVTAGGTISTLGAVNAGTTVTAGGLISTVGAITAGTTMSCPGLMTSGSVSTGAVQAGAVTSASLNTGNVNAGAVNAASVNAAGALTSGSLATGGVACGAVTCGAVSALSVLSPSFASLPGTGSLTTHNVYCAFVTATGLGQGIITGNYLTASEEVNCKDLYALYVRAATFNTDNLTITNNFTSPNGSITNLSVQDLTISGQVESSNSSNTDPTLLLRNNSSNTTVPIQQAFAPNLPDGGNTTIALGKNTSSNSNTFYIKYNHESVENNRHLSIQPHGSADSIKIYKPNIGASATQGTLVVDGGLKATVSYLGSTSFQATVQTIEGSTHNDTYSLWNLVNYSALNNQIPLRILQPNLPTGTQTIIRYGKSATAGNNAKLIYLHNSENNASNNNQFCIEIDGGGNYAAQFQKNGIAAGAGANAFTAQVNGGLKATSIYNSGSTTVVGNTTTGSLTVSSNGGSSATGVSNITNTHAGNCHIQNFYAPNVLSNTGPYMKYGKSDSTNNSCFYHFSHLSDANANNNLGIGIVGQNIALSITGHNRTPGPGQYDYSVEVRGGLKAQNTYITGVASNTSLKLLQNNTTTTGLTLSASSATANYSLIFPSNQGALNQFLQLSNTTTGQLQWVNGTGTGGGGTGVTSVALTPIGAISSIFTGSSAQTGPNVTLNLGVASTPTGSGTQLVLSQAPTFTGTTVFSGPITGSTGSVFGTSGTIPTNAILRLEGDTDNNSVAREILDVQDYNDTGNSVPIQALCSNLALGQYAAFRIGRANQSYNSARLNFNYVADQSNLNYISLTLANQNESIQIYEPNTASTNNGGTLVVNGGLFAQNTNTTNLVVQNGANTMGSNITLVSSTTSPILKIEGDTNNSTGRQICQIIDHNSLGDSVPLSVLTPNLDTNESSGIRFGKDISFMDSFCMDFNHVGDSSTSNNISFTFSAQTESIKISKPDINSAVNTGTLVVNGGLYAKNLNTGSSTISTATIGTTSTSVASNPTVLIQGTSGATEQSPLRVTNNGTASNGSITALAPNLATDSSTFITLGKSLTGGNAAQIAFTNRANTVDNEIALTMFNESPSVLIKKNSLNDTLKVNGGITTTGTITAGAFQTTGGSSFTLSGGTQTCTLWWAFTGTDPTVTNLQYPQTVSTTGASTSQVPNQQYYWQQMGKSYTFSFNLKATLQNTSEQIHILFINVAGHSIPIPACGNYEYFIDGAGLPQSTVEFPVGLMIPAQYQLS